MRIRPNVDIKNTNCYNITIINYQAWSDPRDLLKEIRCDSGTVSLCEMPGGILSQHIQHVVKRTEACGRP